MRSQDDLLAPAVSAPTSIRALILEDRVSDAELVLHELKRSGFEVNWRRVDSEQDYVAALAAQWDVILADYYMPGFNAARALALLKLQAKDIPFIVVTGSISEEVAVEMMRLGAADYLLKDRLARLGQAVRHAIESNLYARLQREAEQALRESEERFRGSFEQAAVGVGLVSLEGSWLRVNQKLCDILGYPQQELLSLPYREITLPKDVAEDDQNLQSLLSGQKTTLSREKQLIRKDGSLVWANVTVSLGRPAASHPQYIIAIIEDISARKRAEDEREVLLEREQAARALAEKAIMAKDTFLAMVSHELRTPLTPVLAAIDLLQASASLPDDARELLQTIRQNVMVEVRLIGDLLDLTRLGTGGMALQKTIVNMRDLIAQCATDLQAQFTAKRIHLEISFDNAPHRLRADPLRLRQVFTNLLVNALKFTGEAGSIAFRGWRQRRNLIYEVADSGIGMEAETVQRLFLQPFEQADQSITRRYGGMGLGLYLARILVELHGGRISATSPGLGRGSTFRVELPYTREAQLAPKPVPAPAAHGQMHPVTARNVLLVEDDTDSQRLLARFLASQGHRVIRAADAREAIEHCQNEEIDLIISDLGLPDVSGWDMLEQLRHTEKGRSIPAIAVSGFGSQSEIERSRTAGFSEHMVKPIDLALLGRRIQELVPQQIDPSAPALR